MTPSRRGLATLFTLCLALTGCGSTIAQTSQVASGTTQAGLGGASPAAGSEGSTSTGGGADLSTGGGSSPGGSSYTGTGGQPTIGGSTGGGTSGGSVTGGTSAGGSPVGRVDTSPIKIGYLYVAGADAISGQFGLKGVATGNAQTQFTALETELNKRGGILGRKVMLIGHSVDAAKEVSNPDQEENVACTDFAQDRRVFVVLGSGSYLTPCLARHGIPTVTGGNYEDPATVDRNMVYDAGGVLLDRLAPVFVDRLAAQGYFTGWNTTTGKAGPAPVKVGLIYQDLPNFVHFYDGIKRALKKHGITVNPADEFRYAATVDGVARDSQAAVLKFQSDGVTHVLGAAVLFFKAAANQQYHPRYGFDSVGPPAAFAANQDASQLHGSLGIGWRPTSDVAQAQDPGPTSPLATRCTEIMRKAGEDVSQRSVVANVHLECDILWSLASALEKSRKVTVAGLREGFNSLGTTTPLLAFGARWAPDRHASSSIVADLQYVDSCGCFAYTKARTTF